MKGFKLKDGTRIAFAHITGASTQPTGEVSVFVSGMMAAQWEVPADEAERFLEMYDLFLGTYDAKPGVKSGKPPVAPMREVLR